MGLLSIFQRNKQTSAKPAGRGGKSAARQAPLANTQNPADAAEAMREVRARARTRLMGATVLLLVGVIGFPLLFETQPRPIPVDLPIEIPARNAPGVVDASSHASARASKPALVASLPTPESVSYDAHPSAPMAAVVAASEPPPKRSAFASLAAALTSSSAPASAASTAAAAPSQAASVAPARPASKPVKPAPASTAVPVATNPKTTPPAYVPGPVLPPPAQATRPSPAAILADTAPAKASDVAAGAGRFVVQVGAFLEDAKVREARAKVEKLGMKTYTQPVDTPTGKRVRVRVGPYATKAEADKNAARLKADGLQAVVLAL